MMMMNGMSMANKATKAEEDAARADYEAECDMKCLLEAAKIKLDPNRLNAALLKRAKMMEALNKIGGAS